MRKRHGQKNAALTNNHTPKESLPVVHEEYKRNIHNRSKTGPRTKD
ncbi:hypothetical protein ACERII_06820 [Evansella sp. AB-rgal1]